LPPAGWLLKCWNAMGHFEAKERSSKLTLA